MKNYGAYVPQDQRGFGAFDDCDRRSRHHYDEDVQAFSRHTGPLVRCRCGSLFEALAGEYLCENCNPNPNPNPNRG